MKVFNAIAAYVRQLASGLGEGWNRFWFEPSDPTILGLMRVLVGLLALYFAASYTPDLGRLLAGDGMLPPATVQEFVNGPGSSGWQRFSYFMYTGNVGAVWAAHVVGLLVLVLFTVGLFSRVTGVLALIVTLAYVHRAPMITGLFEPVLTMLVAYLALAPSGAALSVDRWLGIRRALVDPEERPAPRWSATIALRLMQVHLVVIYVAMATAKLWGDTWLDGMAVWWLSAEPESRIVDLTQTLGRHPWLTDAWAHVVLLHELLFGALIWPRLTRPVVILVSALVWGTLALLTGDVPFSLAMIVANLSFVSLEDFSEVAPARPRRAAETAAPQSAQPKPQQPAKAGAGRSG